MMSEYLGFLIFRLALGLYLVTGPCFQGYAVTESEARHTIEGLSARLCEY